MTLASCALLRESDRCSRPADGRTHRCEFGRTRGARYRIAAVLVGKRLLEWHAHIVLMADPRSRRRLPGYRCGRSGLSHSVDPHTLNLRFQDGGRRLRNAAHLVARAALAAEDMAVSGAKVRR